MTFPSVADFSGPIRAAFRAGWATRLGAIILACAAVAPVAHAYGPRGFDTVVIDAGHGGVDRGGGPGQRIPEKPYTLDTALRLQRALRSRGFRTVMTRSDDTFIPLRNRVAIAGSSRNTIFVSVHYNSAPREGAHGYETYFYRSDSYGLASRLHRALLSTMRTEDRHVRRRGFYVIRNTRVPSVLCECGFLTNNQEARIVLSPSYRQRLAENLANAIVEQSRYGDPGSLGYQPPVTSERLVSYSTPSSRYGSRHYSHSSSRRHSSRRHYSSRHSSGRHHAGGGRRSSGKHHHSSGKSSNRHSHRHHR